MHNKCQHNEKYLMKLKEYEHPKNKTNGKKLWIKICKNQFK